MPQPLSQFIKPDTKYQLIFGPSSLKRYPDLASKLAECIGSWSYIDLNIESMLIDILGAHSRPAHAMFSSVVNAQARAEMLQAATKSILEDRELELCNALLKLIGSHRKIRNKLVHEVWGTCDIVKDAVILMGADQYVKLQLTLSDAMNAVKKGIESEEDVVSQIGQYDLEKIYVYRSSDFEQISRDFSGISSAIHYFTLALMIPDKKADVYELWLHRVESLPCLASSLSLSREHQNNNQKVLPPPR